MAVDGMDDAGLSCFLAMLGPIDGNEERRCCPHCGGDSLTGWGRTTAGRPRWQCHGCRRTFCSTTGTLIGGIHAPDKFFDLLLDMFAPQPRSCRTLAAALGVCRMTIWQWRQRVLWALVMAGFTKPRELAALGRTIVRESRKASREWVRHQGDPARYPAPDRHRWVDYRLLSLPLPVPMADYLVPVLVGVDRIGFCHAGMSPPGACADGAKRSEWLDAIDKAEKRPRSDSATIIDCLIGSFKRFLRPFRGPATKHLNGYVAWFAARQRCTPFPPRSRRACVSAC